MERDPAVCSQCETGELRETTEVVVREVDTLSFEADVPGWRCEQCGHTEFDGPSLRQFEVLIANELSECGAQSGTAFKFMRKTAGLRASELADLLDVDAATISRWETGKVTVDRATLATIGAILRDKIHKQQRTLDHLRYLKNPRLAKDRRRLSLDKTA